jgi:hypothetical protein
MLNSGATCGVCPENEVDPMTEAIFIPVRENDVPGETQHQQHARIADAHSGASDVGRAEMRLPDAISLPMMQYFQQPSVGHSFRR